MAGVTTALLFFRPKYSRAGAAYEQTESKLTHLRGVD